MTTDSKVRPVTAAKVKLVLKYRKIIGRDPYGLGDTLSILTGPDCIELLKDYIKAVEEDRGESDER